MGLRDSILAADDSHRTKVDVPEWGTSLYVRDMSGGERDQWEMVAFKDGKVSPEHFRAKLLVRCLCDEQGQRVFQDSDTEALSAKSATVLARLYEVAARVNGLTQGDVDELTKN
jgi:hypothetical protein